MPQSSSTVQVRVGEWVDSWPHEVSRIANKEMARPVQAYKVEGYRTADDERRRRYSHVGEHVEVNVIDASDIRAAIEELRHIQEEFERRFIAE